MRLLLLGLYAAFFAVTLHAQVADAPATRPALAASVDADMRAEVAQVLPTAKLVGKAHLTVWGFDVYDARLWALPGFSAARYGSEPLALELTYLRAFTAADIADRSMQEMRRSVPVSEAQADLWKTQMLRVIPNVQKGDRILGIHKPGGGASFWVNGKAAGEIADGEFARLFFGIWLSPKTSEPKMRDALLAGAAR
jgi:hypothetical protein